MALILLDVFAFAACLASILGIAWANRRRSRSSLALPPGPPAKGLLGNVADIPVINQWLTFTGMAQKYGPVVHLRALNSHIVVLNTLEAVTELFDRRNTIYSDRPRFHMLDLMGWMWNIGLMPYGPWWRQHRRVLQHFFNEGASRAYNELQARNNIQFLKSLLDTPDDYRHHVRRLTTANVLWIAYGIEVAAENDPWVTIVEEGVDSFGRAGTPGGYLVDWIPALKYLPTWFPGASFKRHAAEWRKLVERMLHAPLDHVKYQISAGNVAPSLAAELLQHGLNGQPINEDVIRNSAGIAYAAGMETASPLKTSSSILFVILSMVLYPEELRKAQDELDRVIGPDRLPQLSDRVSVPYVEAFMLESMRMYPVFPLSLPHRVMVEDEFQGMRIPGGATVLGNVWCILRDERHYPQPDTFTPERFLKDGKLDPTVPDPRNPVFGWGRRICVGRPLADSTIWLLVSTVLACFDVRHKVKDGKKITFQPKIKSGLNVSPESFPCDISPRTGAAKRLVLLMAEQL
ncbi:putative CyP450 monooxygenase [Auricularia subglabra TFB-10046 SS5]|nr:putative CyP450 monooxygenase [Auricularia subglabra TFB-10046 SS5]